MRARRAQDVCVAFIGSAGIPNRYGGFESFVENCAPLMRSRVSSVVVTCDGRLYPDAASDFLGIERIFIPVPSNGPFSVLHDLFAFHAVVRRATHIVVLGTSGGLFFPWFRWLCGFLGKVLIVNVDGLEWRRSKYSRTIQLCLYVLDRMVQMFAHSVVYDNDALRSYLTKSCFHKSVMIPYPGDHVRRNNSVKRIPKTALTICRIEPENNIDMLICGALRADIEKYTIVGNWDSSEYGRSLRSKFAHDLRLELLDPIYDQSRLANLREACWYYLHGHSVGGTNPSLVEMLFFESQILCFDCTFNRETAGIAAKYFRNGDELASLLGEPDTNVEGRSELRERYSRRKIVASYLGLVGVKD